MAPGRDNLLAWYEAPDARRLILFDVHQDTVPADGMTIAPFVPEIASGRLYGRGSCDVKGSMAAMLSAFARLVRERPPGSASVLLACTVDEEFTHTGSSRLAETHARGRPGDRRRADRAEPGPLPQGRPAVEDPDQGRRLPQLDAAPGRQRHLQDGPGRSSCCEKYAASLAGLDTRPDSRPAQLSVGRIEGGQSVNVVPDWCEIEVDRRLIPGEDAATCHGHGAQSWIRDCSTTPIASN